MNASKLLIAVLCGLLALTAAIFGILYRGELEKNELLRSENLKTGETSQVEIKRLKEETKQEHEKSLEETKKLLEQVTRFSVEKEKAVAEAAGLKSRFMDERKLSLVVNEDMDKLRSEIASIRRQAQENVGRLEESFGKKKRDYETRILNLEAQLGKSKQRFAAEADRYHYNLGVVYTQQKDFEQATSEFKTALGYNPKNAQAHYNLGIIYDDYYKDKESARYHYRSFLELAPTSEDADAVREWLKGLDK